MVRQSVSSKKKKIKQEKFSFSAVVFPPKTN